MWFFTRGRETSLCKTLWWDAHLVTDSCCKQHGALCHSNYRDVNLPLFGGIPLFFRVFRVFSNDFPLFLKNRLKKKNTSLQHRHYWESSKSFGKQSLTSSFAGLHLFRFRSEFESVTSTLGTKAGCRWTRRRRWCLNSRSFWSLTCCCCLHRGGGEGGA